MDTILELQLYVERMRQLLKVELLDARRCYELARAARSQNHQPAVRAWFMRRVRAHLLTARKWRRQILEAEKQIDQRLAETTVTGVHRLLEHRAVPA